MAGLIVTFSRARNQSGIHSGVDPNFDISYGAGIRTEYIIIGASSVPSTLVAIATDNFMELRAGADCWVKIDQPTPSATALTTTGNNTSRFMALGERREFDVDVGDMVAVIQA